MIDVVWWMYVDTMYRSNTRFCGPIRFCSQTVRLPWYGIFIVRFVSGLEILINCNTRISIDILIILMDGLYALQVVSQSILCCCLVSTVMKRQARDQERALLMVLIAS